MAKKNAPVAVFDSGVGGLSVLKELLVYCPNEHFLYFGDSANAPYGEKSTEEVQRLTLQAADMLLKRGAKALVIACNTATSAAIDLLRKTYPETVIIGIEPALKVAADRFPTGNIGIMATAVTLREEKLAHQLARFPDAKVIRIPAPGLVELIEQGNIDAPETEDLLRNCLGPYVGKLDALVLGCTHYPFVKGAISKILGDSVAVLDGGEGTARHTRKRLEQADLLNDGPGSVTLENSLGTPQIQSLAFKLLTL